VLLSVESMMFIEKTGKELLCGGFRGGAGGSLNSAPLNPNVTKEL
jgi:hypothetical protein